MSRVGPHRGPGVRAPKRRRWRKTATISRLRSDCYSPADCYRVGPKCVATRGRDIWLRAAALPRNLTSSQCFDVADPLPQLYFIRASFASGGGAATRADCKRGGPMTLAHVSLDDKYDLTKRRIFATGYQALVRLTLMQKELDRRAGLNTAGYVSGYRGSPLGGLAPAFHAARRWLVRSDVVFQAGLNEDLAATALWGTQQAELRGEGKFDGVFGMWYGKGPGVDRCGDVFRHANFAGSSKNGGVLALMGDDHTAESSTTAHQSEYHFVDVMLPILNPPR